MIWCSSLWTDLNGMGIYLELIRRGCVEFYERIGIFPKNRGYPHIFPSVKFSRYAMIPGSCCSASLARLVISVGLVLGTFG